MFSLVVFAEAVITNTIPHTFAHNNALNLGLGVKIKYNKMGEKLTLSQIYGSKYIFYLKQHLIKHGQCKIKWNCPFLCSN